MSGFFNLIKHGPAAVKGVKQAVKTVTSPITHAKNVIKSTFTKDKKPKIGGTKKSDQIKRSNRILKDLDKTMEKDMSPAMKAKGEKLKKEVKETQKQIYKTNFKKGGPVDKKKKKKKKKFPDLTGDGKVTFADILKGRGVINGKKKKKKVI